MDQTLGKPGSYNQCVIGKKGSIKPLTIGSRLYRMENQVKSFIKDKKKYKRLLFHVKMALIENKLEDVCRLLDVISKREEIIKI